MSLRRARRRASLDGALTGAVTALALVASRDEERGSSLLLAALALLAGDLAVAAEERAQAAE
jgi:hypothetical protein